MLRIRNRCSPSRCSGYGPVALTSQPVAEENGDTPPPPMVRKSMEVRVTTVSDGILTGTVTALTDSSLTVAKVGNYGLEENEIPFDEVMRVESEQGSEGATVVAGVLAFMGITVAILFGLILYECHDGCFGT